jgi:quinoprotein glucose dehydrogenase
MPETYRALSQRRHLYAFEHGGTIQYPGVIGGTNWESAAFEPDRRWVILNTTRLPSVTGLIPRETLGLGQPDLPDNATISQMRGIPYGVFRVPALLTPLELPCTKPPWGALLAVDTATGDVKWDVPLGTVQDSATNQMGHPKSRRPNW